MKYLALILTLLVVAKSGAATPNIVFIFADDWLAGSYETGHWSTVS